MAYTPTNWKDRVVEKPRTYRMQENGDGTITLIPEPGTIYEPGTPVNAPNLNKLETGLQAAAAIADAAKATADAAMPKSGGSFTGQVNAQNGFNHVRTQNFKLSTDLPSTYPQGETIFFVNSSPGWPASYGTVHTIKSFTNMACVQFFYPYNVDAPVKYRYGLYNSDSWLEWRDFWDTSKLRWNAGYFEYNDGGTWRAVGGVKGVQRGRTDIGPGNNIIVNVTISAVDLNKAMVNIPVFSGVDSNFFAARLTSTTNLELRGYSHVGFSEGQAINWEVIEHY